MDALVDVAAPVNVAWAAHGAIDGGRAMANEASAAARAVQLMSMDEVNLMASGGCGAISDRRDRRFNQGYSNCQSPLCAINNWREGHRSLRGAAGGM